MLSTAIVMNICLGVLSTPNAVSMTGTIKSVSDVPKPKTLLIRDDGSQWTLHPGKQLGASELTRLSGARVSIAGWTEDPRVPRGQHVWVDRYKIKEIGGISPRVGHIARLHLENRELFIFVDEQGRANVLPKNWVRRRQYSVGSKLWIISASGAFKPIRYALLRKGQP